jgi:hypothetical protein
MATKITCWDCGIVAHRHETRAAANLCEQWRGEREGEFAERNRALIERLKKAKITMHRREALFEASKRRVEALRARMMAAK